MTFYVTSQNTVVLVLLCFGMLCGVFRDVLIAKRRIIPTAAFVVFIEDIIYCLLFTFVYHLIVFVTNYGYVRWYEFAGVFTGFLLYRMSFGRIFGEAIYRIMLIAKRVILFILKPFGIFALKMQKTLHLLYYFLYKGFAIIKTRLRLKRQTVLAGKGF